MISIDEDEDYIVEYLAPIYTLAPSHPIENVGQKNVNVLNRDLVEERKTTKRN